MELLNLKNKKTKIALNVSLQVPLPHNRKVVASIARPEDSPGTPTAAHSLNTCTLG